MLSNTITLISNTEELDQYIDKYTERYSEYPINWLTQYKNDKYYPLPAWIGLKGTSEILTIAHASIRSSDATTIYNKYFTDLQQLPIEAIIHPENYPEYYI